jgi:bifunctional DNase/RNase
MKRRELKILGLSYSQSQVGSYVLVLSDKNGSRKLPLIIKPLEAQRIALELEGIKSPRPLTHDLIKSMSDSYGIDIQEVYIYSLLEGVFYTKLVTSNGIDEVEIECTAGDAMALSVIYKCPIFVKDEIMESAGIVISSEEGNDGEDVYEFGEDELDDELDSLVEPKRVVSIEDLEIMMNEAIVNEEYEIAAEIRDRITELKDEQ